MWGVCACVFALRTALLCVLPVAWCGVFALRAAQPCVRARG